MSHKSPEGQAVTAPSVLRSIKMVAWSFLGIRGNREYQEDLSKVNPMHVLVAALVGVLLLVVGLIFLVNWVVAK
jgi:amino acid transporter